MIGARILRSPHQRTRAPMAHAGACGHELNHVTPSVRTVSPSSLHANLAARICGSFIEILKAGYARGLCRVWMHGRIEDRHFHSQPPNVGARNCARRDSRRDGTFIQTTQRPGFCAALGVGNGTFLYVLNGEALSIAGDRLRHVRRRSRNFSLNARLLGGDLRGEGTEWLPCVGLAHRQKHRSEHGQEVVEVGQGVGQFSQAGF